MIGELYLSETLNYSEAVNLVSRLWRSYWTLVSEHHLVIDDPSMVQYATGAYRISAYETAAEIRDMANDLEREIIKGIDREASTTERVYNISGPNAQGAFTVWYFDYGQVKVHGRYSDQPSAERAKLDAEQFDSWAVMG